MSMNTTSQIHKIHHTKFIPGQQEKILRALAKYKFLTVFQLVRLKTGYKKRLYESLQILRDLKYIDYTEYSSPRKGLKLSRVHYLTPRGATLLVENTPNTHYDHIRYPKSSTTLFSSDYFHRMSSINTHISFVEWCEQRNFDIISYHTYFDVKGSRRKGNSDPMRSLTRIDFGNEHFLDPDGMAVFEANDKVKILMIETYNGKGTKRVLEQLRKHCYVIKNGLAAIKYQLQVATKTCCTFEDEGNMKAVLQRIVQDPYFQFEGIENFFFMGLEQDAYTDFENAFVNLAGERVKMSLCV